MQGSDPMNFQPGAYDIYHDLFIQKDRETIFRAVSDPDELIRWWPLECAGQPLAGNMYRFYFGPEYDWEAIVLNVVPGKHIAYRMTRSDDDWDQTVFAFDLEDREGGTWVSFYHKGWPLCNEHFKRSSFCWALLLQGLKNLVEKGIVVPFAERA